MCTSRGQEEVHEELQARLYVWLVYLSPHILSLSCSFVAGFLREGGVFKGWFGNARFPTTPHRLPKAP